nr:hypothetical protein [Thiolapillus sp.]
MRGLIAMHANGMKFIEYNLWGDFFEDIAIEQIDETWLDGRGETEFSVNAAHHALCEHAQFYQCALGIVVRIAFGEAAKRRKVRPPISQEFKVYGFHRILHHANETANSVPFISQLLFFTGYSAIGSARKCPGITAKLLVLLLVYPCDSRQSMFAENQYLI